MQILHGPLIGAIRARRRVGQNWSRTVTLKENHELIRTGPYRWVRHPIYTGLLAYTALLAGFQGTTVSLCEWRELALIALATAALLLKIRLEEDWMIETFGDGYRRYRAPTIPIRHWNIWPHSNVITLRRDAAGILIVTQ